MHTTLERSAAKHAFLQPEENTALNSSRFLMLLIIHRAQVVPEHLPFTPYPLHTDVKIRISTMNILI